MAGGPTTPGRSRRAQVWVAIRARATVFLDDKV